MGDCFQMAFYRVYDIAFGFFLTTDQSELPQLVGNNVYCSSTHIPLKRWVTPVAQMEILFQKQGVDVCNFVVS